MQRRFIAWAVLAAVMIGGSTVFGWFLTLAIGPKTPDYNKMWGRAPVRGGVVQNVLVRRQFTTFQSPQPPADFEIQEFRRLFNNISSMVENRQFALLATEFDSARMAEEEIPFGFYEMHGQQPMRATLENAAQDIVRDIVTIGEQRPEVLPTGSVEILKVSMSSDRFECLVVALHTRRGAEPRHARWWLKRDVAGLWRAYDFDFPNTRLRFLAIRNYLLDAPLRDHIALGAARDANPNSPDVDAYMRYLAAFDSLMLAGSATDPAGINALAWQEPIEAVPMIPYVQAARQAARARQLALRGNAAQAEATLNAIPPVVAAAAHVNFAKAAVLNAKKNPAGARAAIKNYRILVGDDPIAYLEDARAVAALDGPAAAIAELRKGLKAFPGNVPIAMDLARRLPADRREELGEELAERADLTMLHTAEMLFGQQFPSILDALCTGYLRSKPKDITALRLSIYARIALGQLKGAGEQLKRVADTERRSVIDLLIGRAYLTPLTVEHYSVVAAVGESRRAFRAIAPVFSNMLLGPAKAPDHDRRVERLRGLVAAHRANEPDDPWLHLGEAIVLAAVGDAVKADVELAAGMAKIPPPKRTERLPLAQRHQLVAENWEPFRALRTDLLFKAGKWKKAYEELPPAVDTFDHLMVLHALQRDEFAMAELIELHTKTYAGDLELIAWRGEVCFLKKDHENAVQFYKDYRDKSGKENRQYYRMAERLIRSFVRLKRPDEAQEILNEATDAFPIPPLFHVLVAAAQGDADSVMALFDRHSGPLNPAFWYTDPDLGPLLRGPAFEAVRQKYPPPVR